MDHLTLNLRPKEYFQLAPNMRIAYIELCICLISKSVTYKPGRYKSWRRGSDSPELARNTYIHVVVGLRAKYHIHLVEGLNMLH